MAMETLIHISLVNVRRYTPSVPMRMRGPVIIGNGYVVNCDMPGTLRLSPNINHAHRFKDNAAAVAFIRSHWANNSAPPSNHTLAGAVIKFLEEIDT